jgi:hypothetical protein
MHNLLARRDGALMAHACSQPPKNTVGEMRAAGAPGVPGVLLRLPLRPLGDSTPIDGLITAPLRDDRLSGGLVESVVRRVDARAGVHVHFPRFGFQIKKGTPRV